MKNLIAGLFFLICVTAHAANPSMAQLNFASNSLVAQISAAQVWTNANSTNLPIAGTNVYIPLPTTFVGPSVDAPAGLIRILGDGNNAFVLNDSSLLFNSKTLISDEPINVVSGSGLKHILGSASAFAFNAHESYPTNSPFVPGVLNLTATYWSTNFGGYSASAQFTMSESISDGDNFQLVFQANTDDAGDLGSASLNQSGVWTASGGFASYSTIATNAVTPTGWTNTAGVNVSGYITATAVSFTINDRAGTVLYTSPTLTATLPVSLQNGWSLRAASGLVGTILPW